MRVRAPILVLLAQLAIALGAAPALGVPLPDPIQTVESAGVALPARPAAPLDAPLASPVDAGAIAGDVVSLAAETLGAIVEPLPATDLVETTAPPPQAAALAPSTRRFADHDYVRLPEPFREVAPPGRVSPREVVDIAPPPEAPGPLEASVEVATVALGLTALALGGASLYSRFQKRDVLRSEARARLLALTRDHPGATLAELRELTGMSRGALAHHAQMLEKHALLTSRHDGLHRRYYPDVGPAFAAPRPPTAGERRVLEVLRERGPLTQREIARLLDVTPQAVGPQVHRLREHGRLVVDATDRRPRWTVAPQETPPETPV